MTGLNVRCQREAELLPSTGIDCTALRERRRYATVLIDAQTRQRVEVLPDRGADALEA